MTEENKDYVGMANCFFCGEVKHIVMNKYLKKTFTKNAVYDKEPCENCKLVMEVGVLFIGVKDGESGENPYRTGQIIGIKDKAVKEMIQEPLLSEVLKKKICFVEEKVLNQMGLINKKGDLKYKNNQLKSLKKKSDILKKL